MVVESNPSKSTLDERAVGTEGHLAFRSSPPWLRRFFFVAVWTMEDSSPKSNVQRFSTALSEQFGSILSSSHVVGRKLPAPHSGSQKMARVRSVRESQKTAGTYLDERGADSTSLLVVPRGGPSSSATAKSVLFQQYRRQGWHQEKCHSYVKPKRHGVSSSWAGYAPRMHKGQRNV